MQIGQSYFLNWSLERVLLTPAELQLILKMDKKAILNALGNKKNTFTVVPKGVIVQLVHVAGKNETFPEGRCFFSIIGGTALDEKERVIAESFGQRTSGWGFYTSPDTAQKTLTPLGETPTEVDE